ncbi:MAG: hypothetical protein GX442_02480 [Candidatus Riflebacteria bacterium]|nr:hypothetical protein [Candidatus Riflebacteria bacterium]
MAILKDRKALFCAILVGLLLGTAPVPVVQARSPRGSASPWQPLPRAPNGSLKVPSTSSQVGPSMSTTSGVGARTGHSFSRGLDWVDLGNGTRIRMVAPGTLPSRAPAHDPLAEVRAAALPVQVGEGLPIPGMPDSARLCPQPDWQGESAPGSREGIVPLGLPFPAGERANRNALYQLAPATAPSPITGAQPQPLTPPSGPTIGTGEPDGQGTTLRLPAGANIQIRQLDFRDTDLKDALRSLATLVNINLMLNAQIGGTVTILFSDVTVEEAFNTLLRSYDLAFSWSGSILSIFPVANAPTIPHMFNIQNTKAATIKATVDRLLTPNRGTSSVDDRTNSLLVTDTQQVLDRIAKLLPQIDVKEQSVEVAVRQVTEVFYLDYVDAANLLQAIQMIAPAAQIQAYSSSQASMAAAGGGGSGRSDMMIITDYQSNLDRIRELVAKLDVAPIQVTIDAHIYEIDLNEEERLGINWQKQIPIPGTNEQSFDMSIAPETADAGGTGVFRWGSLNVNQFRALLAMLKTHSFAKVLSNPVITTLNNRQANITVGQAIPYVSSSQTNAQTGNVTTTVAQANANITLLVTPSVTGNDEVFLDISPTISSVLGFTTLGGNSTPNLSNRSAQTQVIIKNNHTIVIGGMIKTDKNDTISKVPFLGDLPGIGQLFRKKTSKESRTELIIFITPHIVRQHGSAATQATRGGEATPRLSLQP